MQNKINPCGCGGHAEIIRALLCSFIKCSDCGCRTKNFDPQEDIEILIKSWNIAHPIHEQVQVKQHKEQKYKVVKAIKALKAFLKDKKVTCAFKDNEFDLIEYNKAFSLVCSNPQGHFRGSKEVVLLLGKDVLQAAEWRIYEK